MDKYFFRHCACALAICTASLALPHLAAAQERTKGESTALVKYIEDMCFSKELSRATVGIMAVKEDGRVLASKNADKLLLPASNLKLITTGAALEVLGSDYRWETSVAYSGEIVTDTLGKGTLKGDVYIIGGGDPTIGLADSIAPPLWKSFSAWRQIMEKAGINAVDGHIIGDGRWAQGPSVAASWSVEDVECEDAPGTYGLNFRGNIIAGSKTPNEAPEASCAAEFAAYLEKAGVSVSKGGTSSSCDSLDIKPLSELVTIGSSMSPQLSRVVYETNRKSDNFMAEVLMRTMCRERAEKNAYSCCDSIVFAILRDMGMDPRDELIMRDGSGLSRHDLITPSYMCRFLGHMKDSRNFKCYLNSLPIPGQPGTMSPRMKNAPEELKRRICMKTGSLARVRTLSGYVLPSTPGGQTIMVSILISGYNVPTSAIHPLLDRLLATIANEN